MKGYIKRLLREGLYDTEDKIWYHGSKKEIIGEPIITVSEFGGTGGFFVSESEKFAMSFGDAKFISKWKIKDGTRIFDVNDVIDFYEYAEVVMQYGTDSGYRHNKPIPNLDIDDYAKLCNIGGNVDVEIIKDIMRKAYPEINEEEDNIYNIIMNELGSKYDRMQYILRNKKLYGYDYANLEKNSDNIKKAGFDGVYVKEKKIHNYMNLMIFYPEKLIMVD
jgi:hypothetical protein